LNEGSSRRSSSAASATLLLVSSCAASSTRGRRRGIRRACARAGSSCRWFQRCAQMVDLTVLETGAEIIGDAGHIARMVEYFSRRDDLVYYGRHRLRDVSDPVGERECKVIVGLTPAICPWLPLGKRGGSVPLARRRRRPTRSAHRWPPADQVPQGTVARCGKMPEGCEVVLKQVGLQSLY